MAIKIGDESSSSVSGGKPEIQVKLEKSIGLFRGVTMIIGIVVGSGIFISPRGILVNTGSAALSLALWLACGLYTMLGAICYAELGTSIPKSGGDYAYLYEAFGKPIAFMYLWLSMVITSPLPNAAVSLSFAHYILKPLFADGLMPENAPRLVAICLILLLTFINCYSVPLSHRVQSFSAFGKIGAIIMIVLTAIWHALFGHGGTDNLRWAALTKNTDFEFAHIALAFYSGGFSFLGWSFLNFVTEEIKDAHKNLPRAIYISMTLITLIYV